MVKYPTMRRLMFLAGTGALGSVAIHLFVPALPQVARDLHATPETLQLAITLYLLGMGLGQLLVGPMVDRIGRRPVMLGGLVVFTVGGLGCALAISGTTLLAARLLQALGAAAGIVAVRTIVADMSARGEAAARIATLTSVQLMSPALAPVIGGFLAMLGGWRAIFWVLTITSCAAFLISYFKIAETRRHDAKQAPLQLWPSYVRLLRNKRFLRFAAGLTCSSGSLYVFLAASSFLFVERYGLLPAQVGLCYFGVAAAGIIGTRLVKHLERRGGAFQIGLLSTSLGGALLLVLALLHWDGPVTTLIAMLFVGLGGGLALASGIAGAMHAEEGLLGTGASLAGALQMIAGGAATSAIVHTHLASTLGMAIAIFVAGSLGALIAPRGPAI
jgi:MFS transporter, DHA1 family, multidrug resistance protein